MYFDLPFFDPSASDIESTTPSIDTWPGSDDYAFVSSPLETPIDVDEFSIRLDSSIESWDNSPLLMMIATPTDIPPKKKKTPSALFRPFETPETTEITVKSLNMFLTGSLKSH